MERDRTPKTAIFVCLDCGAEFFTPGEVTREEYAEMCAKTPYGNLSIECCPRCRSTDISAQDTCIACGKHPQTADGELCEECQTLMDESMDRLTDHLQRLFDISYKQAAALIEEWAARHW